MIRWPASAPAPAATHIRERTAKARITPRRILARHRQQLLDLVVSGGWTAGARVRLPSYFAATCAVPPKDRLRRRERRHLGQKGSAERLPFLREQPSLGVEEAKTLGPEPGPQHAVLGAQVLDRFVLPATDPVADQQDDEELKGSGGPHARRTIAYRPACEMARPTEMARDRVLGQYGEARACPDRDAAPIFRRHSSPLASLRLDARAETPARGKLLA
jgi:hypothetical protein